MEGQAASQFQHLILTRFNIGLYSENYEDKWYKRNTRDKVGDRHAYMAHRCELFAREVAPAVWSQIEQDFRWIIALDPATPADFIMAIREALAPLRKRAAIEYDTGIRFQKFDFGPHLDNRPFVITTHLDSDDILLPSFTHYVRKLAKPKPMCIDFRYYVRDDKGNQILGRRGPGGVCISFVEAKPQSMHLATCYHKTHYELPAVYECAYSGSPQYVVNIHQHNLRNNETTDAIRLRGAFASRGRRER